MPKCILYLGHEYSLEVHNENANENKVVEWMSIWHCQVSQDKDHWCYYYYFVLKITIEAIKSEVDEVSLQGIEFWSTVCDEEMDLAIELAEVIPNK